MYSGQAVYDESINALLARQQKTLMENRSVFDTLLSNMLGSNDWIGLQALLNALGSIAEEKDKSINQNEQMQKFLTFFKEIVINYFLLVLMNPDMFPYLIPTGDEEEGYDLSAVRFMQLLERGFPNTFLNEINDKMYEEDSDVFDELWKRIIALLLKLINNTLIMGNSKSLADTVWNILADIRIVKLIVDHKQFPWIPGPSGINLKGGLGSWTGDNLETSSPLGILSKVSLFPVSINLKASEEWSKMATKMREDLHSAKNSAVFDKSAKKYQEIQHKYSSSLWNIFKQLLKTKDDKVKEDTLRWIAASIVSNTHRTKLGHSLASNSIKKISFVSSDSLCYNVLWVLLELCNPFLKEGDKKLDKIDETYLVSNRRIGLFGETPLWAKEIEESKDESAFDDSPQKDEKSSFIFPKEYGTITEFFFMLTESIHYGLIPIIKRGEDVVRLYERLLEEKDKMKPGHPEYHQMKVEYENMQRFRLIYELAIYDRNLIKEVTNFFKIQFNNLK